MAQTLEFSAAQLDTLAAALPLAQAAVKVNPQADRLYRAQTEIRLQFASSDVDTTDPPQLQRPQRIVSMRLGSVTYTDAQQWIPAWRQILQQNRGRGLQITEGAKLVVVDTNVVTARSQTLGTATQTTATQATAVPGLESRQWVTAVTLNNNSLRVEYNTGQVTVTAPVGLTGAQGEQGQIGAQGGIGPVGPPPTLTIGTVSTGALAASITGDDGDYVLNLQLPGGDVTTTGSYADPAWITALAAGKITGTIANAVYTTGSYADPAWITALNALKITGTVTDPSWLTLTQGKVGLANVTNESKATMFTNSAFTGTTQITSLGVGTAASGVTGEIRASNEITAYYTSDRALKQNITPITEALDKLTQITGVMFDWRDEVIASRGGEDGYFVRRHDTGIIAQDVARVLPEIVAVRSDGTLAVKYEKLMGLIIEAVKELRAEVQQLRTRS